VGQDLVDKHAGEDGDKDADNGETEHCAKTRVDRPVDHLAVRCGREHKPQSCLVVDASMVHDPGKAGARSRRGLVDTLPQRLKPVHVDDGGGDSDDDTEQRREKADAATEFDQAALAVSLSGEDHYHQPRQGHRDGRDVGWDGLEVVEGGGGGLDREVDGHEEGAQHHGQAAAYQRQEHVLLCERAVPGAGAGAADCAVVRISWCWGAVGWSMGGWGPW